MKAPLWQAAYTQALFNGLSPQLAQTFDITDAEQQRQRFAIYQNNVFYSLSQSLADLYPVIKQLVGDDFFKATANVFTHQHPPKRAAMVFFGSDFPAFLGDFEHTQSMPYLKDMAELELAKHRAYHAADLPALCSDDLGAIAPEDFEHARLEPHPSLQLLASQFAVFSLWNAHQHTQDQQKTLNINEPEQVVIVRQEYEVALFTVDAGSFYFWQQLCAGKTVQQAANEATQQYATDISWAITFGIQQGLYTRIILER